MAASESRTATDLGFAEKVDCIKLQSVFFPSKIGGKPAWLGHENTPSLDELKCPKCERLLLFLLQVYAPRVEQEDTFHRTIYLFICSNGDCFDKNSNIPFKAFRNQLARQNNFFDYEPFSTEASSKKVMRAVEELCLKWGALCKVCGYRADKKCSACKTVDYCSKDHQIMDWKSGHKYSCSGSKASTGENKGTTSQQAPTFVLPEFELVTEPEEDFDEAENLQLLPTTSSMQFAETDPDVNSEGAFATVADKHFQKFKEIISKDPEQVLRYNYGGEPLWVSSEHQAKSDDIPNCSCGAKRVYEFQILPQLLNYLDLDDVHGESIDFGTLAVYTCSKNCPSSSKYISEFVWQQDFSDVDLKYE